MKIAYLSFESPQDDSGVGRKLAAQLHEWRSHGHAATSIVLRPSDRVGGDSVQYVNRRRIGPPMLTAALDWRRVRKAIDAFNPDIVYMRQMIWWPGLLACLRERVVIDEVNSDILRETPMGGNNIKLRIYKHTREKMEAALSGRIAVTRELAKRYILPNAPITVISNGFTFSADSVPLRRTSLRPQFILVASADRPWHGADVIVAIARLMTEADFHLVGPFHFEQAPVNVHLTGVLDKATLSQLYTTMDFGLGPLALSRKSMDEACPLKVREYIASGLPVIAGYFDTDLSGEPYFLDISSMIEKPQEAVERIRRFVQDWTNRDIPHTQARDKLSAETKELERLDFFGQVLDRA